MQHDNGEGRWSPSAERHTPGVPVRDRARSLLATIVGYLIVIVIAIVLLRFVLGTILWVIRAILIVVVLLALITVYLRLKAPD
jgi:membrane protein YdbS with pleckstrin-like domain